MGRVGYYSVLGNRSPHLEGKPGSRAHLLEEIKKFKLEKMKRTLLIA